jgi:2-keto-4-pentenoate hydratase
VSFPASKASPELVDALVGAWRSGKPLSADTARRLAPASEAEAYAAHAAVGQALGWWLDGRPRAWKLTSREPAKAAPSPDAFLLHAPAQLRPGDWHTLVGIEVELAVRLSRPLASGCSRDEAAAAVAQTWAAIEVFDVRAEDWRELPPTFLLADLQMHGRLVLGSGVAGPWQDAWAEAPLTISVNSAPLAGVHRHPLGDPLTLLPWLAEHAERTGWPLQAGDIISTGIWGPLIELQPGDALTAEFAGVGAVELSVLR